MKTLTAQIQIEIEEELTQEKIDMFDAEINKCCHYLEQHKLGYIRAQTYLDGKVYEKQ